MTNGRKSTKSNLRRHVSNIGVTDATRGAGSSGATGTNDTTTGTRGVVWRGVRETGVITT
jgi:hypothetical protein